MAVTKIRKVASWILLACTIITLAVLGLFFFGGDNEPYKGEMWNPVYVDTLLYWQYVLFALTVVGIIIFAIIQFATNFKQDPKSSMTSFVILVLFFGMMFITYSIGDTTKLPVVNSEAQVFNTDFWLKVSDMWLYSTYVLTALVVLAVAGGSVKRLLKK
jgi:hypothetical protein